VLYLLLSDSAMPLFKERKKTFNGKWQASSNSSSQWATKSHAYSMDLIFIGKSQGWQHGSLNSFLWFCFLSSVVSHLQVWHHVHKNIVNFTYLYLRTHVSILYDNSLPIASTAEENWFGMPSQVILLSNRQTGYIDICADVSNCIFTYIYLIQNRERKEWQMNGWF
jgi:hypothetical protein